MVCYQWTCSLERFHKLSAFLQHCVIPEEWSTDCTEPRVKKSRESSLHKGTPPL